MKPKTIMENNQHKLAMVSLYQSHLLKEFVDQEYGQCMFYPEDIGKRQAKFILWLADKYGIEEKFLNDVEKFELFLKLKQ